MNDPKAILTDIAPEFSDEDSDRIDRFIELAEARTDKSKFGQLGDYAVALRAAHMMTLSERSGTGGAITMQREGDLQTQFAQTSDQSLDSTAYGQQLRELIRENITSMNVTGRRRATN